MTIKTLINAGDDILRGHTEDHENDSRLLFEHISGLSRAHILAHPDEEVDITSEERYFELINRRKEHIPLQHLTGTAGFMGLDFKVDERVLVPRQDTETLAEEALKCLHAGMKVLDLCTGSGCIIISLMKHFGMIEGTGSDISDDALTLAEENARLIIGDDALARSGIGSLRFVKSDLLDGLDEKFDVIVSNPPYIKTGVIPTLMEEVREHDPYIALDGGDDGLKFYKRIISGLDRCLSKGGTVLFEIGNDQAEDVSGLLDEAGYKYIEVIKDLSGNDRVVKAIRPVMRK